MNMPTPDLAAGLPARGLVAPERTQPLVVSDETLEQQNVYGFLNGDTRARPFKLLRSQILKNIATSGAKLIGVTSATPGVGKSFVAANLGAALSRISNVQVYLVDLDLQRPSVAKRFAVEEDQGLHDYLSGAIDTLEPVARRVNDEQFVILPGFARQIATGELLSSENCDRLFAALRALPDNAVVLIDMPPIFADDDTVIISGRLDGFLLVAEDGRTTTKQVRDTILIMQPTPLIGTVLNRYRSQIFADDYGYGAGYGYGQY